MEDTKEKKVTKEAAISDETSVDLYRYMAQNNSFEFNMNKALEECTEFMEVLIKLQTKSKKNPRRPSKDEAYKEFGDVMLRGGVALMALFPEDENVGEKMLEYMESKHDKLREWLKKGTYENGL